MSEIREGYNDIKGHNDIKEEEVMLDVFRKIIVDLSPEPDRIHLQGIKRGKLGCQQRQATGEVSKNS